MTPEEIQNYIQNLQDRVNRGIASSEERNTLNSLLSVGTSNGMFNTDTMFNNLTRGDVNPLTSPESALDFTLAPSTPTNFFNVNPQLPTSVQSSATATPQATTQEVANNQNIEQLIALLQGGVTETGNLESDLQTFGTAISGGFSENNAGLGIASGISSGLNIARNLSSGVGIGNRIKELREVQQERKPIFNMVFQEGGGIPLPEELTQSPLVGSDQPLDDAIANLEGGEKVMQQDGNIQEVVGDSHEEGGVDVTREDIPGEANVLSDETPIGKDNSKHINDLYQVKTKAKDTFSQAQDKVEQSIGVTDLKEKQEEVIKKLQEVERSNGIGTDTKDLNKQELLNQVDDIETQLEQLSGVQQRAFQTLYEMQEAQKPEAERDQNPQLDLQEPQPQEEGNPEDIAQQMAFKKGGKIVLEDGGAIEGPSSNSLIKEKRNGRRYVPQNEIEKYYFNNFVPTSPFGTRISKSARERLGEHGGVDLAPTAPNTDIPVMLPGKVVRKKANDPSLGNFVEIKFDGIEQPVKFGHLSTIDNINAGDTLQPGDIIGKTGNTGERTTGEHLHMQFKSGHSGDIMKAFVDRTGYDTLSFSNDTGLKWKQVSDFLQENPSINRDQYFDNLKRNIGAEFFDADEFNKNYTKLFDMSPNGEIDLSRTNQPINSLTEANVVNTVFPNELYDKLSEQGITSLSQLSNSIPKGGFTPDNSPYTADEINILDEALQQLNTGEEFTNDIIKPEREAQTEQPSETSQQEGETQEPSTQTSQPNNNQDNQNQDRTFDVDSPGLDIENLPNPFRSFYPQQPSAPTTPEQQRFRATQLSVNDLNVDAQLAEIQRNQSEALDNLGSLPPAQRAEAEARIREQSLRNRDKVLAQANQVNLQNQQNVLNQNRQILDNEQLRNIGFAQDFEQKVFRTADVYENSLQNWYDAISDTDRQTRLDNQSFRARNQLSDNYVMLPNGQLVLKGEGYSAQDALRAVKNMTPEEREKLNKSVQSDTKTTKKK